jgi:hypothetical protein
VRAPQCHLIKEVLGAFVTEIVIIVTVINLRIDITRDLAAKCGVSVDSDVGSYAEPANIGFSGQTECLAQVESPSQTDRWIGPTIVKRKATIQLVRYTVGDPV